MEELKIRGYVTPDDIEAGRSDTEKLQKALYLSAGEDIGKVIVDRDLVIEETVKIPAGTELKFQDGVTVTGTAPVLFENEICGNAEKASWSFEDKWIYIISEGNASLNGNIRFWHAGNLVIEDMEINGSVSFEFCREVRMERNTVRSDGDAAVVLMRGCNNFIVQYNRFEAEKNAFAADASLCGDGYVMGKDTDIHELIIRENEMQAQTALFIGASEESGVFNVQYDHTKTCGTGIVIGHENEPLDKKRYFNISATEFTGTENEKLLNNPVRHCYFG